MKSKRYVIDTNILVSRLLLPDSIPAKVVRYIFDNGKVLISDATLNELSTVLFRSKFDKYVSLETRKLFIDGLKTISIHLEIEKSVKICRDSKDNQILEIAINGGADAIITGDNDLLILKEFEKIKILSPKDFYRDMDYI